MVIYFVKCMVVSILLLCFLVLMFSSLMCFFFLLVFCYSCIFDTFWFLLEGVIVLFGLHSLTKTMTTINLSNFWKVLPQIFFGTLFNVALTFHFLLFPILTLSLLFFPIVKNIRVSHFSELKINEGTMKIKKRRLKIKDRRLNNWLAELKNGKVKLKILLSIIWFSQRDEELILKKWGSTN